MEFAYNHLDITEETWAQTIFMDEKVFSTHKDGRLIVWRPQNARFFEYLLLRFKKKICNKILLFTYADTLRITFYPRATVAGRRRRTGGGRADTFREILCRSNAN